MNASTKKFAQDATMSLPGWAKGVLAIGILGGLGYIAYRILRAPKDIKAGQGNRQEDLGWNKEFDQLNTNAATKATISKAQMAAYANSLFAAMDGVGTDNEAIIAVFAKIQNDADFAGINAAYGVRELSSGKWNPVPNFKGTLTAALTDEVPMVIKEGINNIMAKKKITYKI